MLKIFCIYDKKASSHMQPFYFHNKAEALRALADNLQDKNSLIAKHPADFSIWQIGEFNEQTGVITAFAKAEFLEECTNCVQKENPNA